MGEDGATTDDAALVLAARDGDKDAFAQLLSRHRDLLLAICRRAVGDVLLAEDAAQEAALQALLGLDRLRYPAQFGPWLAGIGLNLCRSWHRRRVREVRSWATAYERDAPQRGGAGWHDDPATQAERSEERAWVRHAVAALPRGQRDAVILFYLSGLTQDETAAALGIAPGAVRGRLHKARATLRRQLVREREESVMPAMDQPIPVDVEVMTIRRRTNPDRQDLSALPHIVVLEERGGARRLPLFIDAGAAQALAQTLTQPDLPPPPTHALAVALATASGGTIREVEFTHLAGDMVYATILLDRAGEVRRVDARPSDALNVALLARVPMRVHPTIFATVDAALAARGQGPAQASGDAAAPEPAGSVALLDGGWKQWSTTDTPHRTPGT